MQLKTIRIDLGDGDYAEVYEKVLRVTARLHEAELKKYMTPVLKDGGSLKMLASELDALADMPKLDYQVDLAAIDDNAVNELYIFNQVVSWSFGPVERGPDGSPLNPELIKNTIDQKMTREQYKTLVREMDRLYKPLPLLKEGRDGES